MILIIFDLNNKTLIRYAICATITNPIDYLFDSSLRLIGCHLSFHSRFTANKLSHVQHLQSHHADRSSLHEKSHLGCILHHFCDHRSSVRLRSCWSVAKRK